MVCLFSTKISKPESFHYFSTAAGNVVCSNNDIIGTICAPSGAGSSTALAQYSSSGLTTAQVKYMCDSFGGAPVSSWFTRSGRCPAAPSCKTTSCGATKQFASSPATSTSSSAGSPKSLPYCCSSINAAITSVRITLPPHSAPKTTRNIHTGLKLSFFFLFFPSNTGFCIQNLPLPDLVRHRMLQMCGSHSSAPFNSTSFNLQVPGVRYVFAGTFYFFPSSLAFFSVHDYFLTLFSGHLKDSL